MAKKTFQGGFKALLGEIEQNEKKTPTQAPTQVGRPQVEDTQSTSKQGLRQGLTRMTFIVREDYQDKLKYCAFKSKRSIKEILNEAIEDYVEKWERTYGPIDLLD